MTVAELHKMFKVELDKYDELSSYPSFLPKEIDYFINSSILRWIKTRMSGLNVHRTGLEQSQKRIDDLRTLTVSTTWSADDVPSDMISDKPAIAIDYPSDYMFEVGDSVRILTASSTYTTDTQEAKVENIDSKLNNSLSDFRLRNNKARPIKLRLNNKIYIIHDHDYSIDSYTLIYISTPQKIDSSNADSELNFLPEHAWDEVIVAAARLALENISDNRYSTYSQESQLVE
jgi:hypothetical protein